MDHITNAFLAYVLIFGAMIYFLILNSNASAQIFLSAIAIGLGGYLFFMLFDEAMKFFVNISTDLGEIKRKIK